MLLERAQQIPWQRFDGIGTLGITAGASAPEALVNEMVDAFRARFNVTIETVTTAEERIVFHPPRELRDTLEKR